MRGKTIVITGGTSGIGEVATEALAQMGARIVFVARNKSRADATLARLRRSGPGARPLRIFCRSHTLGPKMKRAGCRKSLTENRPSTF